MRILIKGSIYQKPLYKEGVPNHSLYAMLMNRLPIEMSKKAHEHKKNHCLFTYSSMNVDFVKETFQFYFSAQNEVVENLIESFETDILFRVGNYYMKVSAIDLMPELEEKSSYLFKGKVLISNGSRELITNIKEMEKFLSFYAENKLTELELNPDVKFVIYDSKPTHTFYKRKNTDGFNTDKALIPGHYITVGVTGEYESVKMLYNIGFGQNTGTGNGMLWEGI